MDENAVNELEKKISDLKDENFKLKTKNECLQRAKYDLEKSLISLDETNRKLLDTLNNLSKAVAKI